MNASSEDELVYRPERADENRVLVLERITNLAPDLSPFLLFLLQYCCSDSYWFKYLPTIAAWKSTADALGL